MIKNECKIVRDLFPNYIENQLSDETKEFMDEHLKKCNECDKILKDIQKEEKSNNKEQTKSQDKEVNYLKKYNKVYMLCKIIIVILICIIVCVGGKNLYQYISVKKLYNIDNMMNKMVGATENLQNLHNYTFEYNFNNEIIKKYYQKDNYFREEVKRNNGITFSNCYGKNDNDIDILFYNYDNLKYIVTGNADVNVKRELNKIFDDINKLQDFKWMDYKNVKIIEQKYNDINCYVVKETYGELSNAKLYIDKENMLPIRYEEVLNDNTVNFFIDFKYEFGTVTDDDVKINSIEGYEIIEDDVREHLNEFMN